MLESLTYQMNTMTKEEQNLKLGGDTAMLKVQATKVSRVLRQGVPADLGRNLVRQGRPWGEGGEAGKGGQGLPRSREEARRSCST